MQLEQSIKRTLSAKGMIAMLIFLVISSLLLSDTYTPSMPVIQHYFATTSVAVKWTLSIYMFGAAFSQLIAGPVSDRYGRRGVILTILIIAIIGSLICLISQSITMLLLGRLVQGMGAGALIGLVRTMARDWFSGDQFAKVAGMMSLAACLSPGVGPFFGGYLQHYFGWHSVFVFAVLLLVVQLIVSYYQLPESNQHLDSHATEIKAMGVNYLELFKNEHYMRHLIVSGLCLGGLFSYFSINPFLIQTHLGYSPVAYAWLILTVSAMMILGRIINVKLIGKLSVDKIIYIGVLLMMLGGLSMYIPALLGIFNVYMVVIPTSIFVLGSGFVFSNVFSEALRFSRNHVGAASGLYSAIQMGSAALFSAVAANLPSTDGLYLGAWIVLLSLICMLLMWPAHTRRSAAKG